MILVRCFHFILSSFRKGGRNKRRPHLTCNNNKGNRLKKWPLCQEQFELDLHNCVVVVVVHSVSFIPVTQNRYFLLFVLPARTTPTIHAHSVCAYYTEYINVNFLSSHFNSLVFFSVCFFSWKNLSLIDCAVRKFYCWFLWLV